MSGASEATAVMANREPFTVTHTVVNSPVPDMNPAASQPQPQQQTHVPYTAAYREAGSSPPPTSYQSIPPGATVIDHVMNLNSSDQKRKRGRPRKYGPDGGMAITMASPHIPSNVATPQPHPQAHAFSEAAPPFLLQMETYPAVGGTASPTVKKARGRPRGSSNKKHRKETLGSTASGFVPHILNVNEGEDVSSKIMSISQNGPRAVCVVSASGAISNVTLRQTATSGGTATYEGPFDILSLSGSFMLSEVAGQKSRTGGLSISLAGPNGRVLGGCIAGLLIAASPVQVIVGSFLPEGHRETKANYVEPSSAPAQVNMGCATGASNSPSRGTPSESSGGLASPLNLGSGACNNMAQGMSGMPWK